MPVTVASLDEGVAAVRALVALLLPVRLLMVDHVAELGGLDMTLQALEKLVGSPSLLIDHVMFFKAHVARIGTVPVADSLLDGLLQDGNALRGLPWPRRGLLRR